MQQECSAGQPRKQRRPAKPPQRSGCDILGDARTAGSAVVCCGMAASPQLETNVYPFILRDVSLLGVSSAECPMPLRKRMWDQLASAWKIAALDTITQEIDLAEVERFVAREARRVPGIFYAVSRSDILEGRLVDAPLQEKIRRSFSPGRSGNVHLVQNPYWFLHSTSRPWRETG